jgi:hypothetical protein
MAVIGYLPISQDFPCSGIPTWAIAKKGVVALDISTGNKYIQSTAPYGNDWRILSLKNIYTPGGVQSVTDDGTGVIVVDNTDSQNPVVGFGGVYTDGVTVFGNGTPLNPLVSAGSDTYQVKATVFDSNPAFLDQKIACVADSTILVTPANVSGFDFINIRVIWSPRTVFESRNMDVVTLNPGDPVYVIDVNPLNNIVDVGLADASNPAKMPAVGLVWGSQMFPNLLGGVIMTGLYASVVTDPIDGITPSTGDKLYVKAGGGLTTTMPTGGDIVQNVGVVGNVSAISSDGSIIVGELLSGSSGGGGGYSYTDTLVNTTPYNIVPVSGANVYLVDATIGAMTINMPSAVGNNAMYVIKKIDSSANTVTVVPSGAQTIDGLASVVIRFQNTSIDIYSDGSNLYIA